MAERIITLEQLEELVARHPGRALELHQKLSSPSRRRPLPDTIQRHRARQASAQIKREQLLQDKSNRMRELLNKVRLSRSYWTRFAVINFIKTPSSKNGDYKVKFKCDQCYITLGDVALLCTADYSSL